jgi:hypothetical protein
MTETFKFEHRKEVQYIVSVRYHLGAGTGATTLTSFELLSDAVAPDRKQIPPLKSFQENRPKRMGKKGTSALEAVGEGFEPLALS